MQMKDTLRLLLILAAGIFFRLYNLLFFHYMTADECVYTQAVFAMTKGCVPYKDIFIAHPLLYFLIEYPFIYFSPSLLSARLVSILLSVGTMLLVFHTANNLYSRSTALLALAFFALSPYVLYYNKLAVVENAVLFFISLTLYFFFRYCKTGGEKNIFACGFFSGLAFLSKYSALLVVMVIVFFVALKGFKKLMTFTASALIMPSIFLILLVLFNVHQYWFIQTVIFQTIRFDFPVSIKLFEFGVFFALSLPLFAATTPILFVRKEREDIILILLYGIPFMFILLGKVLINHYFLMLAPILCIIAAKSFNQYINLKRTKVKKMMTLILLVFTIHFLLSSNIFLGSPSSESAVRAKMEIANYIKSITTDNDKIWTTEADIAFFAERLIVTPNSTIWKYQGFYEDVWGFIGTSHVGEFAGYSGGLITINEIQQALESEKPKVIVIMKSKITDILIWNGINTPKYRENGLKDYILTKYCLNFSLYDMDVYVIKTGKYNG